MKPVIPTTETAPPSAAPGTEGQVAVNDKPRKRNVKPKSPYPGLLDPDGNAQKLKEVPTDWDTKKHKPLARTDFADEAVFFDFKAVTYGRLAETYKKKAEETRLLGSTADRAKAKKLMAFQEKAAALRAELEAAGVDVSAIMAMTESK